MKRILFAAALAAAMTSFAFGQVAVKKPNVSGQFYSSDAKQLAKDIDTFLSLAPIQPYDKKIAMIICPHAGYVYSGPVAAYSYKAINHQQYSTVVIVALSHFSDFEGFAIWPEGSFETPLGNVGVDKDFSQKLLSATDRIKSLPSAFEREHSLEVQLPFLQKTLKNFKIVALLTGRRNLQDSKALAAALDQVVGKRDDVLIVISTDMSHYHDDATARRMDRASLSMIKELNAEQLWTHCLLRSIELCGFSGTTAGLFYARLRGLDGVDILKYGNSGDVTGDKKGVVGYGAVAFYKKEAVEKKEDPKEGNLNKENKEVGETKKTGDEAMTKKDDRTAPLNAEQKKRLLEIAQKTIQAYVEKKEVLEFAEPDPRLSYEEGAFVTIHKHGQLRGCIGNILGKGPLYKTVRDMAIASATEDQRFKSVSASELKDIDVEISVLSKPWRVTDVNQIQMGVHGVIVGRGFFNRGVFLPQVATETGWTREEFLSNLCAQKAGLPPDAWKDPQTAIEIFTAQVFSEKDIK